MESVDLRSNTPLQQLARSMYRFKDDVSRECIECDNENCGKSNPQKRCSRCQCAYYCDASCQKTHWKEHKQWCKRITLDDINTANVEYANPVPDDSSCLAQELKCGICLEENESIINPMFMPGCNHVFCFKCIHDYQTFLRTQNEYGLLSRKENTCPMCRTQVPRVDDVLIERALQYGAKANTENNVEERDRFCDLALGELKKVLDTKGGDISALFVKSQLLLQKDQPEHAVDVIQSMIDIDKQGRDNAKMFSDLIREGIMLENMGRHSEADQINKRLEEYQRMGLPVQHIDAGNIDLFILLAYAKIYMNDWSGAVEAYKKKCEQILSVGSAIQTRKLIMGLCHCHFELGEYDRAIDLGEAALEINRHFASVHKYIALSQEKIGNIEGAKKTMCRAVLYETPWDKDNVMENVKQLNELISRM